jgi:hypothetical protein
MAEVKNVIIYYDPLEAEAAAAAEAAAEAAANPAAAEEANPAAAEEAAEKAAAAAAANPANQIYIGPLSEVAAKIPGLDTLLELHEGGKISPFFNLAKHKTLKGIHDSLKTKELIVKIYRYTFTHLDLLKKDGPVPRQQSAAEALNQTKDYEILLTKWKNNPQRPINVAEMVLRGSAPRPIFHPPPVLYVKYSKNYDNRSVLAMMAIANILNITEKNYLKHLFNFYIYLNNPERSIPRYPPPNETIEGGGEQELTELQAEALHDLIRINGIPNGSYIIYNKILMPVSVWIEIPHNVTVKTIFNTFADTGLEVATEFQTIQVALTEQMEGAGADIAALFGAEHEDDVRDSPAGQAWYKFIQRDINDHQTKAGFGDQPYFQSPGNISELSYDLDKEIGKDNIKYIFSQEVDENREIDTYNSDKIPIIQLPQNNMIAAQILYPLIHPGTMSDLKKDQGNVNACNCKYTYDKGDETIIHNGGLDAETTLVKYFSLAEADAKMAVLEEALAEVNAINTTGSSVEYTTAIKELVKTKNDQLVIAKQKYNTAIKELGGGGAAAEGGGKKRKSKKSKKSKKGKKGKKGKKSKKGKKGKKGKNGKNGKKNKSMKNKSMKNKSMKNKTKKN